MRRTAAILLWVMLSVPAGAGPQSVSRATYEVLTRAESLLREERHDAARTLLTDAWRRADCCDAENALLLQTLANLEIQAGDYPAAAGYLEQALDLDALPDDAAHALRLTLARLYARLERHAEAARALETWFAAEPQPDADAHLLAAQVYGRLKRFDPAIRHARRALAGTSPPPENHHRLLLGLLLQAERWKPAASLLEQEILVRYPDRAGYWRQLAALRLQLGQEARAAATLELAQRRGLLAPRDIERLARLQLHLGAPLKAARLLDGAMQAGRLKPTAGRFRLLADAWQLAREPQRTLDALTRAGGGRDLLRAGELLLERERWSEAADSLRAALARGDLKRPGRAQLLLGMALARLDDEAGAREAFRAAAAAGSPEQVREQAGRWLAYLASDR